MCISLTNIGPDIGRGIIVSVNQPSSVDEDDDGPGLGDRLYGGVNIEAVSWVAAVLEGLVCLDDALVLFVLLGLEGFVDVEKGEWDIFVPSVAEVDDCFSGSLHFGKDT